MACSVINLPPVKADFCAPTTAFGQIDKIYLGNQGRTPFTDVTALAELQAVLSNDDIASLESIRTLHVIASKPAAETNAVDFSQGRKVYTEKKHSIPLKIDEVHEDNYDFLIFTEENPGQQYKFWYSVGDLLYGGVEGIDASILLNEIIPESDQELIYFEGTLDFEGKSHKPVVNPLV